MRGNPKSVEHPHRVRRSQHPAPRKRFAQHFLEPAWVDKLIRAIDPQPGDTFIEIGPGRGALTRPLAARAQRVIACEIDRDLAAALRASMPPNVAVVEGDFLRAHPESLIPNRVADAPPRVAGNLPYNVASPIMFALVDWTRRGIALLDATLMLQREVADRLLAAPGSRDYGVLSVLIRHRAAVTRALDLPAGAFRPPPKVQSTVVRLTFHPPDPAVRDDAAFAALVKALFSRRRKTVANALLAYVGAQQPAAAGTDARRVASKALALAGIDPVRRPEALTIAELAALSDILVA